MHTRSLAILCAALLGAVVACGGGKKAEKKNTTPATVDAGATTGVAPSKMETLCKKLCAQAVSKCSDAATKPNAEECVFACVDETDGVLEEAGRCLDKAADCDAAKKCRARFDGDKAAP